MRKLRLLPEVLQDTIEAAKWHDERKEELGNRFLDSFRASLKLLQKHPLSYPAVLHEFRKIQLKSFPYAIYFRMVEEEIVISLVYHLARNPATLKRLLRRRRLE